MEIPYEKRFHFRDGSSIGSLDELKAKIESLSYQEFYNHVNTTKNDFASWVQYVLKDDQLAADLRKVTSIVETVEIINDYLHPRPITAQRSDTQSQIESTLFTSPMPSEAEEVMPVEQVPVIAPAPVQKVGDFKIIEEKLGLDQPKIEEKVKEELFGRVPDAQPAPVHSEADMSRMILKDFMYGVMFGLVIGVILGRIVSF